MEIFLMKVTALLYRIQMNKKLDFDLIFYRRILIPQESDHLILVADPDKKYMQHKYLPERHWKQ